MLIGYNAVKDHQVCVVVSSKNHSLNLNNTQLHGCYIRQKMRIWCGESAIASKASWQIKVWYSQ